MSSKTPRYRRYRGRPSAGPERSDDPLRELRDLRRVEAGQSVAPEHPAKQRKAQPGPGRREPAQPRPPRARPRPPWRRIFKWFLVACAAWIALSLVVFMISAQFHQADVGDADAVLGGGGTPPVGTRTVLVIGSDTRPKNSQEPGARTTGYGLADSIMLLRIGGGKTSKLSIARDTMVPIEGHGVQKINSAYAYGGPDLLVRTVQNYTGVDINHVMQISFSDFPGLIDAMGGITYKGSCVISKISGGYKNGGVTLRIRTGERVHLNGKQALALSRTRHNACNSRESDLTRAHRQQKVLSSMKRRALSPIGFIHLPQIAWEAPKTMNSDMAGPALLTTMAGLALSRGSSTTVIGTETGYVPAEQVQRKVQKFLGE